ncbi:uncharacterized protein N7496_010340, partial [Penicillium cataractarum]
MVPVNGWQGQELILEELRNNPAKNTAILMLDPDVRISDLFVSPAIDYSSGPFWVYIYLVEKIVSLEESAIGKETMLDGPRKTPQAKFQYLHDVALHAIHVAETLNVSTQTLEHILAYHHDYLELKDAKSSGTDRIPHSWEDIHSQLSFLRSYLNSMRHRSTSLEKRLQNEIQQKYNFVAQESARLARLDSATMKRIIQVTLIFLPPTFICALFSMSFFNYGADSGWPVSNHFWIYWASAIPTTLVTVLVWQIFSTTVPSNRVKTEHDLSLS